jgi:hypothetical protein
MKRLLIVIIVLLAGFALLFSSCSTCSPLNSPSVDVSDNTLNQFTDYQGTLLLRHLASSAYWQLKDYGGTSKVIRRQRICGVLQMSFNGVYTLQGRVWMHLVQRLS